MVDELDNYTVSLPLCWDNLEAGSALYPRVPQWGWASATHRRNLLDSTSFLYWLSSLSFPASLLPWDHLPNKLRASEYSARGQMLGERKLTYIQSHCFRNSTWVLVSLKRSPLILSAFLSLSFSSGHTPALA